MFMGMHASTRGRPQNHFETKGYASYIDERVRTTAVEYQDPLLYCLFIVVQDNS